MKKIARQVIPQKSRKRIRLMKSAGVNSLRLALKVFSEVTRWKYLQKKTLNTADLPVFEFSPHDLQRCLINSYPSRKFILEGDWDTTGSGPIAEVREITYSTVKEIFVGNIPYTKTAQYKKMIKAIELYRAGEVANPAAAGGYWCRSHDDVHEYFAKLHRAYDSIKTHGYKKQSVIQKENPGDIKKDEDEIQVLLDRNGDIVLGFGGTHRTIITQILQVEKVYVKLRGVHKEFIDELSTKKDINLEMALKNHLKLLYKPRVRVIQK